MLACIKVFNDTYWNLKKTAIQIILTLELLEAET